MKKISIILLIALSAVAGCYFFRSSLRLTDDNLKEVVIIDKSLENFQDLVAASDKKSTVILVENNSTGFSDLERKLKSLKDVERLHILTHGTSGNFVLGRNQLNEANLDKFKGFWQVLRNTLASEKSELLIYSCQLASGEHGKSFVNRLNKFLGISVAGSEDNTGSEKRGGNWKLEYEVGNILKEHVLRYVDFKGLLVPTYTEFTGASSPFDAMTILTDNQLIYGDFDSDGDIDIHLYKALNLPENEYWQNNGSGGFTLIANTASPFRNVTEKSVFYNAANAHVADWDNDGDDDIYVTSRASGQLNYFYKNNGGIYQEIVTANSPFKNIVVSGFSELITGDFDADGDIDICAYPGSQLPNVFWKNDGAGNFSQGTGTANPFRNIADFSVASSLAYAHVADWDNDGDVDIFVSRTGTIAGQKAYYRNDAGVYVLATNPFSSIVIDDDNQLVYGDFDADGDIDLNVSSSDANTTLKFWQNNGSGTFTDVTGAANPFNSLPNAGVFFTGAQFAYVADWDNDKDVDVLLTRRNTNQTGENIFYRQSDAPPLLTSSNPANGATGVSVEANIVLNFNRAVTAVAGKNITIKRTQGDAVVATIPVTGGLVSGSGTTAITIDPSTDFDGSTSFYLLIDKGAFKDVEGRIYEGIVSKTKLAFTTGTAPVAPSLLTATVTIFGTTSATLGGNVTSDGGKPVTDRGIVWNTSTEPTISNNKTAIGSGTGTFSQSVTGIPAGTLIYVRAYATNSKGTAYGNEVSFYTKTTVSSITRSGASPTNAGTVDYSVVFAQSVTGVDVTDFTVTSAGVSNASVSNVTGSGTTYTVTVNTGTGNGTVRLDFTGLTGTLPNVNAGFNTADAYTIYKVSTAANSFRTKSANADWNQIASWESSADNTFWIAATIFPGSSATVVVNAGQTINLPTGFNASAASLTNNGTINTNTGTVSVSGTFTNPGTLKGSGNITNGSFTNAGIIAPGNSPGTLAFTGNLTNSGSINVELGGTVAGTGFDKITVSGTLVISGTLNVTLINGFVPVLDDEFIIIDAASSTGTFQTLNLPSISPRLWETSYDNVNGTVKLKVINDPLPVTLVGFDALKKEAAAALSWTTSSETNSSHFEIERSTRNLDWESIGTVKAQKESSVFYKYQFFDLNPLQGENLYRLKMIDLDGTFAYSKIKSVAFDQQVVKISTYPNPVTEQLFLDTKNVSDIKDLQIYNTYGTLIYKAGSYTTDGIQVKNLPQGLYILKLTTTQNQSSSYKFVKN